MEFLSRNPDIVQVHNAFSETEVAEASASNLFPWVTSETDSEIEKKLGMMTGLVTKGPRAADPTILVSHLPGGHSDISADTVGEVCVDFSVILGPSLSAHLSTIAMVACITARRFGQQRRLDFHCAYLRTPIVNRNSKRKPIALM